MTDSNTFDEDFLSTIFDEYYAPIYRYIYYHIGHRELAQDLTGDVFSRFLDQIKTRNAPPKNYRNWLFRVARNLVIDERRRLKYRYHLALEEDLLASPQSVEDEAETKVEVELALRILEEMPPNQATTIIFRFIYGMSLKEIAAILDLTIGAVKALQHRGIQSLRKQMTDETSLWEV